MRSLYRDFLKVYSKNIVWIYFLFAIVWGYGDVRNQIPEKIYVKEGTDLQKEFMQGLTIGIADASAETLAEVRPFSSGNNGKNAFYNSNLHSVKKDCKVNCYLFGVIPVKRVEVSVTKEQEVYTSGRLVGIYEKADGVLVLDTEAVCDRKGNEVCPAKNKVKAGDYIISMNGEMVHSKMQILQTLLELEGETVHLEMIRDKQQVSADITPVLAKNGSYMLGIWIKDDMAGIGTMTYYTKEGEFGALGHGIGDGTTGELLSVSDGAIYDMELTGIEKGKRGAPGELAGTIHYSKKNHFGTLQQNEMLGIFGQLDPEELAVFAKSDPLYPVAYKQEIRTNEKAYMISDVSGTSTSYEIEIEHIDMNAMDSNKGIQLKVTDPDLLDLTGGVVQGLSGSPIIQNGKIIGAVTHVLVNDPTRGYGIFIEEMLGEK